MNKLKQILSGLFFASLLILFPVIYLQRQNLLDWWRLRDYSPAPKIAELADGTTMTDYGRKLFYVHYPELNNREEFNQNCSNFEQTIVLGCYITHRAIYIFDVEDKRLEGIEEVTAAHEVLHAAYDRLSREERTRVDRMTKNAFDSLDNERIKSVVMSYEKRDASVVPNELHSILGTEVRDLPTELENYYKQYFTDRGKIVGYSEQYENVFTKQQSLIKGLAAQITVLEEKLVGWRAEIEAKETEINASSQELNLLKEQNRIEEYNLRVPGHNARIRDYRALINTYNSDVKRLNELIDEHNQLAVEQKELNDAINSKVPAH